MLSSLQRNVDPCGLAQLACPHPGAVDDELGFDLAGVGAYAGDGAATLHDTGHRDTFEDGGPLQACSLGQCHRHVHGIGATILLHVEAGEDVVGASQWEQLVDFLGRDLVHINAAVAIERGNSPVLLEPIGLGRQLDEADSVETRRLAGLRLEARVQIARVLAHLCRRLRQRAERDHQARRVPGGAGSQPVALQDDDIGTAHVGKVVGNGAPDHTSADHHHASTLG